MKEKFHFKTYTLCVFLALFIFSCNKDDASEIPPEPQNKAPEIQAQSFSASEAIDDITVIGKVVATDADKDALTFSIKTNSSNLFEITGGGDVSLASNQILDFETAKSHTLSIGVTDGKASSNATVTINVTDVIENGAPVFSDQSFGIRENANPGSEIGMLIATDPDGDTLTYAWVSPDDGNPAEFFPNGSNTGFVLDANTGSIRTVSDEAGTLDFESRSSYPLPIIVSDGELSTQANIIVNVTDVGEVRTFSGYSTAGNTDGSIDNARFTTPTAIARDSKGNLYIADTGNSSLRKITIDSVNGSQVSKVSLGNSVPPSLTVGGLAFDGNDNLYISDYYRHVIYKYNPQTGTTVFAGVSGTSGFLDSNGTGPARFNNPSGLAYDSRGVLIVADKSNHSIRRISLNNGNVTTISNNQGTSGFVNGVIGDARYNNPVDVAIGSNGTIYVADAGNHCIRAIASDINFTVTTFSGDGVKGFSENNQFTGPRFDYPSALAFDSDDNLYVTDRDNNTIYKITVDDKVKILTFTRVSGFENGFYNDVASPSRFNARFNGPSGIAVDASNNLYIGDSDNHVIRYVQFAN